MREMLAKFWHEAPPPQRVLEIRRLAARILVWEQGVLLLPIAIAGGYCGNSVAGILIVGGAFAAISMFAHRTYCVELPTRMSICIGMLMDVLLLIYALNGTPSLQLDGGHMWIFAVWSHCFALLCWRSLLASGVLGVGHHFALIYLLPLWVFPDEANLGRVALHGAVVSMQFMAFIPFIVLIIRMLRGAERLEAELQHNAEVQREARRATSQFLANMSHELTTPLNAILGFSDVMHQQAFGPIGNSRYREYCADIHRSGTHLAALITNVLDLSKIAAGKMEINTEDTDIRELCENALRITMPLAKAKGNSLSLEKGNASPVRIRTDPTKLMQCLLNLLSNACKYTKNGRISVSAEQDPRLKDAVVIAVTDTGIGIEAQEIDRIFEMFSRSNSVVRHADAGSGVGLALTRELARLLGGDVQCQSQRGIGSIFTLTISALAPSQLGEASNVPPEARSASRRHSLIGMLVPGETLSPHGASEVP
jgi:two-component system, sensor histidine kinase and response regulator